jgi:molecular chaperone Hsp33
MTAAHSGFADALAPFVFEHGAVRGAVVSLDATCSEILGCHAYPPALAQLLAELLAASALLAATLKFGGSLIVQLQGAGPVRLLVVECAAGFTLRATAQWTEAIHALPASADLATLAGTTGRLAITLDPKNGEPVYQGIVALEAASIATLIEHYLETSEQIPSRMLLASERERVRGMLLQRLPGATDADLVLWEHAAQAMQQADAHALLAAPTAAALVSGVFPEDDLRLFRLRAARFGCSCTRERVDNALRMVGRDEVEDILAEQGQVSVTCEFCNREYGFSADEARALFVPHADAPGPSTLRH